MKLVKRDLQILSALTAEDFVHIDAIGRRTGIPFASLYSILEIMRRDGWIQGGPVGWWLITDAGAAALKAAQDANLKN